MKRNIVRKILLCIPVFMTWGFFVACGVGAHAEESLYEGLRINEIQVTGATAKDEFIELYNDSNKKISLAECSLMRHIKGKLDFNEYLAKKGVLSATLEPKQYFVLANSASTVSHPDAFFQYVSYTITGDNSVALFCPGLTSKTTIDGDVNKSSWSYSEEKKDFFWTSPTPKEKNTFGEEGGNGDGGKILKSLRLNEFFPNPKESPETDYEFIEVYNFGEDVIDLTGWKIVDKNGEKTLSGSVASKEYRALYKTVSLNNSDEKISLKAPDGEVVDAVEYGDSQEGWSYAYDGTDWRWTPLVTPDKVNEFPKNAGEIRVRLNEVLPNAEGDGEEFVELYNPGESNADISFWSLRDKSGASYLFPKGTTVSGKGFLVVERGVFNFALNDSDEILDLLDAEGNVVDTISYETSKEGVSWAFDGSRWRASLVLTPGAKNSLNGEPSISDKSIPKKGYKNMWVYFSAEAEDGDGDEIKYRWDFGDGHKSYMRETKHKYEEEGEYTVELQINDGREPISETSTIEISSYPKRKVRIVAFEPNPEGKDSEGEWIRVKNEDKKTVNLLGWSFATGKDKKHLGNHPISQSVKLKKGKELTVTRGLSKISLNNKKGVIELRSPDGKMVDRVKYEKGTGIQEGDIYQKEKGKSWAWKEVMKRVENLIVPEVEILYEPVPDEFVGESSEEEAFLWRGEYILEKKNLDTRVLGTSSIRLRLDGNRYVFAEGRLMEHYAVYFWRALKEKIRGIF